MATPRRAACRHPSEEPGGTLVRFRQRRAQCSDPVRSARACLVRALGDLGHKSEAALVERADEVLVIALSPIALRAALMRLDRAASETIRPSQISSRISSFETIRSRRMKKERDQVEDLRFHMHDFAGPAQLMPSQIEFVVAKNESHYGSQGRPEATLPRAAERRKPRRLCACLTKQRISIESQQLPEGTLKRSTPSSWIVRQTRDK